MPLSNVQVALLRGLKNGAETFTFWSRPIVQQAGTTLNRSMIRPITTSMEEDAKNIRSDFQNALRKEKFYEPSKKHGNDGD